MNNIFTYAFVIGAAQGFLLIFFLLKKKENRTANTLLAITMFFFAIDLILEAAAVTEYLRQWPFLIGLMQAFPYLYGPSIYLYIYFITRGVKSFDLRYLSHYSPFILVQIYALFFFYFESTSYQLNWIYRTDPMSWHLLLISYILPIYSGLYIALAIYEAYKFNKELKNEFSSIDQHNLSWVNFLIISAVLLWVTAITMTLLQLFYYDNIKPELVSYLAISIFIYSMAYKGLKQPELIYIEKKSDFKDQSKKGSAETYKKSGLNDEDANIYLNRLVKIMDEQKPYKNDKLNLTELSKLVGISNHNLSEIINTKKEQNFYDFINSYRIEEAMRLIEKDKNAVYSILSHGFEAGFTSKSAFYSAFKKNTGVTPAHFRKESI